MMCCHYQDSELHCCVQSCALSPLYLSTYLSIHIHQEKIPPNQNILQIHSHQRKLSSLATSYQILDILTQMSLVSKVIWVGSSCNTLLSQILGSKCRERISEFLLQHYVLCVQDSQQRSLPGFPDHFEGLVPRVLFSCNPMIAFKCFSDSSPLYFLCSMH